MSQLLDNYSNSQQNSSKRLSLQSQTNDDTTTGSVSFVHLQNHTLSQVYSSGPSLQSYNPTNYTPNPTTGTFSEFDQSGSISDDAYQYYHNSTDLFPNLGDRPIPDNFNGPQSQEISSRRLSNLSTQDSSGHHDSTLIDYADVPSLDIRDNGDEDNDGEDEPIPRGLNGKTRFENDTKNLYF